MANWSWEDYDAERTGALKPKRELAPTKPEEEEEGLLSYLWNEARERAHYGAKGDFGKLFSPTSLDKIPEEEDSSLPIVGKPSKFAADTLETLGFGALNALYKKAFLGVPQDAPVSFTDLVGNPAKGAKSYEDMPLYREAVEAIKAGDVETAQRLLKEYKTKQGFAGNLTGVIAEEALDPTNYALVGLGKKLAGAGIKGAEALSKFDRARLAAGTGLDKLGPAALPYLAELGGKAAWKYGKDVKETGFTEERISELPEVLAAVGMPALGATHQMQEVSDWRKRVKAETLAAAEAAKAEEAAKLQQQVADLGKGVEEAARAKKVSKQATAIAASAEDPFAPRPEYGWGKLPENLSEENFLPEELPQVKPEVNSWAQMMGNSILYEINQKLSSGELVPEGQMAEKVGETPFQRVVVLEGNTLPDGTQLEGAAAADPTTGTIYVTSRGVHTILQAPDAGGAIHNFVELLAHEATHTQGWVNTPPVAFDPITGQPAPEAPRPAGHGVGAVMDDSMVDLRQQFVEYPLIASLRNSGSLANMAQATEAKGILKDAFHAASPFSPTMGTYEPGAYLTAKGLYSQLDPELGQPLEEEAADYSERLSEPPGNLLAGGGMSPKWKALLNKFKTRVPSQDAMAKAGFVDPRFREAMQKEAEANKAIRSDPQKLEQIAQEEEAAATPVPPLVAEPGKMEFTEKPAPKLPVIHNPRMRALQNIKQLIGSGPLENKPNLKAYIERAHLPRGEKPHFYRWKEALDEMVQLINERGGGIGALREVGITNDTLSNLVDSTYKEIYKLEEAQDFAGAADRRKKLAFMLSRARRASGSSRRAELIKLGEATPRQTQAHLAGREHFDRQARKPSKGELRQMARLQRHWAAIHSGQLKQVEVVRHLNAVRDSLLKMAAEIKKVRFKEEKAHYILENFPKILEEFNTYVFPHLGLLDPNQIEYARRTNKLMNELLGEMPTGKRTGGPSNIISDMVRAGAEGTKLSAPPTAETPAPEKPATPPIDPAKTRKLEAGGGRKKVGKNWRWEGDRNWSLVGPKGESVVAQRGMVHTPELNFRVVDKDGKVYGRHATKEEAERQAASLRGSAKVEVEGPVEIPSQEPTPVPAGRMSKPPRILPPRLRRRAFARAQQEHPWVQPPPGEPREVKKVESPLQESQALNQLSAEERAELHQLKQSNPSLYEKVIRELSTPLQAQDSTERIYAHLSPMQVRELQILKGRFPALYEQVMQEMDPERAREVAPPEEKPRQREGYLEQYREAGKRMQSFKQRLVGEAEKEEEAKKLSFAEQVRQARNLTRQVGPVQTAKQLASMAKSRLKKKFASRKNWLKNVEKAGGATEADLQMRSPLGQALTEPERQALAKAKAKWAALNTGLTKVEKETRKGETTHRTRAARLPDALEVEFSQEKGLTVQGQPVPAGAWVKIKPMIYPSARVFAAVRKIASSLAPHTTQVTQLQHDIGSITKIQNLIIEAIGGQGAATITREKINSLGLTPRIKRAAMAEWARVEKELPNAGPMEKFESWSHALLRNFMEDESLVQLTKIDPENPRPRLKKLYDLDRAAAAGGVSKSLLEELNRAYRSLPGKEAATSPFKEQSGPYGFTADKNRYITRWKDAKGRIKEEELTSVKKAKAAALKILARKWRKTPPAIQRALHAMASAEAALPAHEKYRAELGKIKLTHVTGAKKSTGYSVIEVMRSIEENLKLQLIARIKKLSQIENPNAFILARRGRAQEMLDAIEKHGIKRDKPKPKELTAAGFEKTTERQRLDITKLPQSQRPRVGFETMEGKKVLPESLNPNAITPTPVRRTGDRPKQKPEDALLSGAFKPGKQKGERAMAMEPLLRFLSNQRQEIGSWKKQEDHPRFIAQKAADELKALEEGIKTAEAKIAELTGKLKKALEPAEARKALGLETPESPRVRDLRKQLAEAEEAYKLARIKHEAELVARAEKTPAAFKKSFDAARVGLKSGQEQLSASVRAALRRHQASKGSKGYRRAKRTAGMEAAAQVSQAIDRIATQLGVRKTSEGGGRLVTPAAAWDILKKRKMRENGWTEEQWNKWRYGKDSDRKIHTAQEASGLNNILDELDADNVLEAAAALERGEDAGLTGEYFYDPKEVQKLVAKARAKAMKEFDEQADTGLEELLGDPEKVKEFQKQLEARKGEQRLLKADFSIPARTAKKASPRAKAWLKLQGFLQPGKPAPQIGEVNEAVLEAVKKGELPSDQMGAVIEEYRAQRAEREKEALGRPPQAALDKHRKKEAAERLKAANEEMERNSWLQDFLKDEPEDGGEGPLEAGGGRSKLFKAAKAAAAIAKKLKPGDFDPGVTPYAPLPTHVVANAEELFSKPRVAWAVRKPSTSDERVRDNWLRKGGELLNITRPLVTGGDLNAVFRNTWQLTMDQLTRDSYRYVKSLATLKRIKDPNSVASNVRLMLKSFASDAAYHQLKQVMEGDPVHVMYKKLGGNFISERSPNEAFLGERLLTKATNKAKGTPLAPAAKALQWFVQGSNRAHAFYTNKIMTDAFRYGLEYYNAKSGGALGNLTEQSVYQYQDILRDLVKFIDWGAGRGRLENAPVVNEVLSNVFYSAQLNISRGKMLASALRGFTNFTDPVVRMYARRQTLRAVMGGAASTMAVYLMLSLMRDKDDPEVTLEYSPFSTDFAKLRMGPLSVDLWGGNQQWVRLGAQVTVGKKKNLTTGELENVQALDAIARFARGKLGPGVSTLFDIQHRRTVGGEVMDPKNDPVGTAGLLAKNLLLPLNLKDIQGVAMENPWAVVPLVSLIMLGHSVSTYRGGKEDWLGMNPLSKGSRERHAKENRLEAEYREQGVRGPRLSHKVSLPGRDLHGNRLYYRMTQGEIKDFEKAFMPIISDVLYAFINTEYYQNLPRERRPAALARQIHMLNQRFGAASQLKRQMRESYLAGKIKPSGIVGDRLKDLQEDFEAEQFERMRSLDSVGKGERS